MILSLIQLSNKITTLNTLKQKKNLTYYILGSMYYLYKLKYNATRDYFGTIYF